jgi:hypothetical protein
MKRTPTWAIFAGTVVLVGAIWAGGSLRTHEGVRVSSLEAPAVGTAGREAVPEPYDSPATLHDLETMTGAVDQHALLGSHVDFHARVADVADSTSFWIGSKDNRVPVTAMTPVIAGQFVRITGMIDIHDQQVYIRAESVTPE